MTCGKAILETPNDVVEQIHRPVLKKLAVKSPSWVENHVVEVGRFSDTWAPKRLRGRRLYAAVFHAISKPVSPDDPFTSKGADYMTREIVKTICGTKSTATTWSGCLDSAYESACPSASNVNYGECFSSYDYGPYLFTINATPSNDAPLNSITAFAKPCPVASSAPSITGKPQMSDTVKLRCYDGLDATNKAYYNRYVAVDSSTNTYSFTGLSVGTSSDGDVNTTHWMYSIPGSSVSKGASDVYYYFFTAGFYYA
jgi:hypothetical protein